MGKLGGSAAEGISGLGLSARINGTKLNTVFDHFKRIPLYMKLFFTAIRLPVYYLLWTDS